MWQVFKISGGQQFLEMQNNNVAGVRNFVGGQQFLEMQNNNVAGVRTFVGGQQVLEVQNKNMAGVRTFVGGQQFLEMQNNNVVGVRTFFWRGGASLFVYIKHFTFRFPKSVDLNKLPNFVFSFNLAITYETSGGEYINCITLITNIQPSAEYVSNITLQLTVTNMVRMRSLNNTQPDA
jgi:hypothetical protein